VKVVPELTELTRRHPYRETFWRQLMLGLYRSDRQSDALATFREAAGVLADDLGIDPGPALAAMHQAVLTQDPALDGPAPRHELPPLPGELIGRDVELDRLLELVRTTRLVTLTGTGGVGKTRLALEVAHYLGAEFVPLADVHTAEAAAARITGSGSTLLVLDNLEQIHDADALVLDLLDKTERKMLITSRSVLHLHAETVVGLTPLASTHAAELFTSEAHRVGAAATLDESSVTAICHRLDGLPLALVLAAARCRLLTPAQMLSRLGRGGLGEGPKDLPDRQRTLAATVQWSVELLDPPTRDLFADLSVFAAPFTVEASEEVSNPDALGALVDASLLTAHEGRLSMLETIRDCARGMLAVSGRGTRERHARWVLRQVAELAPRLNTAREEEALGSLGALLPEIRAATEYLSQTDADAAADMLVRTRRVWFVQGLMGEIRERLDRVAPLVTASRTKVEMTALQAEVLELRGRVALHDGKVALAHESLVESLATREQLFGSAHPLSAATRIDVAVADFDDQPAPRFSLGRLDQQRRRKMTGDHVRMHGVAEQRESSLQIHLPERLAKFLLRALGNVVYEYVELSLFFANSGDQLFDSFRLEMIHNHRNPLTTPSCHKLRRLFDRLRPICVVVRRQRLLSRRRARLGRFRATLFLGARAAARAIDCRACLAKRQRRSAAHSTRGSGYERDAAAQFGRAICGIFGHGAPPRTAGQ
jgi:predicted ATPase